MVAGREVDELVGSASIQLRGDVAARLMQGQRVTLPVSLNDGRGEGGASGVVVRAAVREGGDIDLNVLLLFSHTADCCTYRRLYHVLSVWQALHKSNLRNVTTAGPHTPAASCSHGGVTEVARS
jgi:hypothetical protein